MNGMDDLYRRYEFYLKVFEKLINEIYNGNPEDASVLLVLIGELIINVIPHIYLKHRRVSYEDFVKQLDNYLKEVREETIKEYRKLLLEEKF